jgi:hypothetical protein
VQVAQRTLNIKQQKPGSGLTDYAMTRFRGSGTLARPKSPGTQRLYVQPLVQTGIDQGAFGVVASGGSDFNLSFARIDWFLKSKP